VVTDHIVNSLSQLIRNLSGCDPIHKNTEDVRIWGSLPYSFKEGYSLLIQENSNYPRSRIWKFIGEGDSLPKINALCWVMVHNKLLTAKNMAKRGVQGPSRCTLCKDVALYVKTLLKQHNTSSSNANSCFRYGI
jgi:hypothetical protein